MPFGMAFPGQGKFWQPVFGNNATPRRTRRAHDSPAYSTVRPTLVQPQTTPELSKLAELVDQLFLFWLYPHSPKLGCPPASIKSATQQSWPILRELSHK